MSVPIRKETHNPARNWQINPARNWQINPARNWQINPARNWQINPARNWQINPARNWQINPTRNWQINPARNWQINPARNWQVNPLKNYQVNPSNLSFNGLYVIGTSNGVCEYYLIRTCSPHAMLCFDDKHNLSFFFVGEKDVFSIFTCDFEYVGYLCPNSKKGYNWFDLEGNWLYFVV